MLQWLNIESGIYVQHTWFMRKEEAGMWGGDKVEGGNIEATMRETSQEELVLIIIIFLCLQI